MALGKLVLIEWLLILAAGMTFMGGVKGITLSLVILSGILYISHPSDFWLWEIPLLIFVIVSIIILLFLARKSGKSGVVIGLAGGIATFVVFGAFVTPLLALLITILVVGTGLAPEIKPNQILWSMSPVVWRLFLGLCWIIIGNLMI